MLALASCLATPRQAEACGGPCAFPRFYGLSVHQEQLVVTTNFGLLYEGESDWHLVCEESIGGLLLSAMQSEKGYFANTGDGLFSNQHNDVCRFSPESVTDSEDYLLDFSIAAGTTDTHVALVQDQQTNDVQIWGRAGGEAFSLVHSLGTQSGHRRVVAAGDLTAVYALGYVSNPRRFTLAFSVDGQAWQEYVDEVPTRSLSLAGIDPAAPDQLYLWLETANTEPSRLLRFETKSGELTEIMEFAGTEAFAGFTVGSSHVYVAGRSDEASSLYAAARDGGNFERVQQSLPPLDCLLADGERLYACGADFSRSSAFLVAVSADGGASWEPRMRLRDLGTVASCGTPCQQTTSWLYSTFAPTAFADAGAPPADTGDTQDPTPHDNGGRDSGGCQAAPASPVPFTSTAGALLLAWLCAWRSSRRRES